MSEEIKRNCNTCKFELFDMCDTLRNHEEYQTMRNARGSALVAYEFKNNFICDGYKCRYIEYPIEVLTSGILRH